MDSQKCKNCDAPCGPDDMFCENCGYDFITGSLPGGDSGPAPGAGVPAGEPPTPGGPEGEMPVVGDLPAAPSVLDPVSGPVGAAKASGGSGVGAEGAVARIRLTVAADRTYFDQVVNDGEIDFPDPPPAPAELELAGPELHIGRTSDSRAIHPDIDVSDLTGDQAVSSRHAVLRVDEQGACTITDVGSTNGTFLDDVSSEAIAPGAPVDVKPGTEIYLGAWTRLTLRG